MTAAGSFSSSVTAAAAEEAADEGTCSVRPRWRLQLLGVLASRAGEAHLSFSSSHPALGRRSAAVAALQSSSSVSVPSPSPWLWLPSSSLGPPSGSSPSPRNRRRNLPTIQSERLLRLSLDR